MATLTPAVKQMRLKRQMKHRVLYFRSRYGYNSFTEECERFNYSGCGGNENRFIRKYECEKACRSDKTCCGHHDYKIY